MAASDSLKDVKQSMEDKLKKVLAEELERRYKFSETLQKLLTERSEMETVGGVQTTVGELTDRMDKADATINALLRDLCLEEPSVSRRRERGMGATSQDMETTFAAMATASDSPKDVKQSMEDKLKKALAEELDRRYKFSETLQKLRTERSEMETVGGVQTTVGELTDRMDKADATINALLRDLCLEEPPVSRRREKAAQDHDNQERDSGYSPSPANSADLDSARRQAVLLRASTFSVPLPVTETGLPEMVDRPSLPTGCTAMAVEHAAGEPIEHSDDSPQDDTT